jgi:hypothetical protein
MGSRLVVGNFDLQSADCAKVLSIESGELQAFVDGGCRDQRVRGWSPPDFE